MSRKSTTPAVLALFLTTRAVLAVATDYDVNQTVILDGYVKSVDWTGSDLKFVFHSNDGYDTADWAVQGPATAALIKMGWTKDMLKAGDHLDTVVHPASDGSPKGELMRFYLHDGRTMEIGVYGTTQPIPREALNRRFDTSADDPMYSLYGNTQVFYAEDPHGPPEANFNGRVWFNPDHSLLMFSNDMNDDRKSWRTHVMTGTWWLEKQQGKWVRCNWFEPSLIPYCHSPGDSHNVGGVWSIDFRGVNADWIEHRTIEPGHH